MTSAVGSRAAPPHDKEPVSQLRLGVIDRWCEVLCGVALVAMIVLIGAEAIARNIFGFSLQVTDEVGGYLLVAVSFLSLSVAQSRGAFHHVELVQGKLKARGRLFSGLVFDLLSLGACAIITWQLVELEIGSWQTGDTAATPLGTPLWLPQLVMPVGTALFCIAIGRSIVRKAQLLLGPATREGTAP
jgi:TRAP-type C4-dicarboxylate transport system permease small subunit